jgi:hypothetical protein
VKLSLVVLAVLLCPAVAGAQAPAGAELAGGAITRVDAGFAGAADVGMKVSAKGDTVTIRAAGAIVCGKGVSGEGEASGTGPIAADGTFSLELEEQEQEIEADWSSSVRATGQVAAGRATGTLRVDIDGPGDDDCVGTLPFTAVTVGDLSGAAPVDAPRGATLFGRMLRPPLAPSGAPFSFNLRMSADGRTVRRFVFGFHHKCSKRYESFEQTWYVSAAKVRADESFRRTERTSITYSDVRESLTAVVEGHFVTGGATGTARVRSVLRSRKTRRVVGRCDSGLMAWSAIR